MAELRDLKSFDIENSSVVLWTYKVSGAANENPRYNARWVDTDDGVKATLKEIVERQTEQIEETHEYSLTVQNNEASALTLQAELTHAGLLTSVADEETENRKVKQVTEIQNSAFYAIKFVKGDRTLFAIRKTGAGWKTKRANGLNRVFYSDERLALDDRSDFEIEKSVDMFILDGTVFLFNKNRSESVLKYKQAHLDDFEELRSDQDFRAIFADSTALVTYIGSNKMQLRRAAAIRQKGHYKDRDFITRLRAQYRTQKLNIDFDGNGKIIATEESAPDIMTALLDHRLSSVFSQSVYDVQDTQPVL